MTTLLPFLLALLLATGCGTVPSIERRVASQGPPPPLPVSSVPFQVSSAAPQVSAPAAPLATAPATNPPAALHRFTVVSTLLTVIQTKGDLLSTNWQDCAVGTNYVTSTTNAARAFYRADPDVRVVHLKWDASTSPEVTGYMLYNGPVSGGYTEMCDVGNLTEVTVPLRFFPTNHLAATAYNASREQSDFSNEALLTGSPLLGCRYEP